MASIRWNKKNELKSYEHDHVLMVLYGYMGVFYTETLTFVLFERRCGRELNINSRYAVCCRAFSFLLACIHHSASVFPLLLTFDFIILTSY